MTCVYYYFLAAFPLLNRILQQGRPSNRPELHKVFSKENDWDTTERQISTTVTGAYLDAEVLVTGTVNGTQLPSINHLPSSLLSHGRKAVGKPLHLRSPLKWCGISIATVLACSCVCLARSGHLVGPPVGSCEPGLLLHHGTCGPNGVATALVKSSVSSSCI